MDGENPYAVPESVSGFAAPVASIGLPADRYYVDGKFIMCGATVELPEICVLTGRTDDLVKVTKTVSWLPKWYFVLVLFGVIGIVIFLVLRVIQQKKCQVSFYLSRSIRNLRRILTVVGWIGFIASIVFLISGVDIESPAAELLVAAGLAGIIGFLVMTVMGQLPIGIDHHGDGVRFWLKGFKQPFFDQLRTLYADPV